MQVTLASRRRETEQAGTFSIQRINNTSKQRRHYQHRTHNQKRNETSDRKRTSSTIHHVTQSRIHQNNIGKNGAQTASNPITNRQLHGRCIMQQKNTTKMNKSNGHAIPLSQRQTIPKTIQNILATRQRKLCRLLDKTPPSNPPQKHKKCFLTLHIILEMLRLEEQQCKRSK